MSRPSVSGTRIVRLAAATAAIAAAILAGASARAASVAVGCGTLQSTLNGAHSGDVIVLAGLCSGSYTLPAVAITLTGSPGTTSGFDGAGATTAPLLSGTVDDTATLTLSSLSFLDAQLANAAGGGGLDLVDGGPGGVSLSGDTFIDDTVGGAAPTGGGLLLVDRYTGSAPAPFAIADTTFSDDGVTAASGGQARGGGADVVVDQTGSATDLRALDLSGDSFTSDSAVAPASPSNAVDVGGGLDVEADGSVPVALTQSHDSFVDDSVLDTAASPAGDYGGGGEWVEGFDLASTDDVFAGNAISGTSAPGGWSWGGGLAIVNGCQSAGNPTASTGLNLVAAGNTITGGAAALSGGAGIYIGCGGLAPGNDLALADSTVTANHATAGGVAGIAGEPVDHLALANTIDTANAGGPDLGGFGIGGGGGSLTASDSDTCIAGAAASGAGDICAAPALDGGTDVHETAASPTIDAGSNALVPAGVATDVFGDPRIDPGGAGVVDIGAAEYVHPAPEAVTGPATAVTQSGAELTGSVDPQGTPTSYSFEYGTTAAYGASTPAVTGGAGAAAVAAEATIGGLAPATTYDYRLVATSPAGTADGANMAFTTPPPLPAISGLAQSHRRWRVGPLARAARRRHVALGTTFSYTLNVAAMLTFTFTHRVAGRLVAGACVAPARRNRGDGRCRRVVTAGILAARAAAGPGSHVFAGILGGHRFGPGAYTLALRATSAAGETSAAATIGFTIVRA